MGFKESCSENPLCRASDQKSESADEGGTMPPLRLVIVAAVLAFGVVCHGQPAQTGQLLKVGDVFTGQMEGLSEGDGSFEIRAHSPVRGAATITETGTGSSIGQMTACDDLDMLDCAGAVLEKPIFGYLNVTGIGRCSENRGCIAPPDIQPATGCREYGCWSRDCGCDPLTGSGCWGSDLRGAIVLVQRGFGVGEPDNVEQQCTFSLKIWNAQKAGAEGVIVFNNQWYGSILMGHDGEHEVSIPAVFVDRSSGLMLYHMFEEASAQGKAVDVSITNMTESSVRLTIEHVVSTLMVGERAHGTLEYRVDRGSYGRFNVTAQRYLDACESPPCPSDLVSVLPACPDATMVDGLLPHLQQVLCAQEDVIWQVNPGRGARAFGFSALVRTAGTDGLSFEHMSGSMLDDGGHVIDNLRAKLRRQDPCAPEVQTVLECDEAGEGVGGEAACGRRCHVALDNKNYRVFDDGNCEGAMPLMWYCRDPLFCEGTYLVRQDLDVIAKFLPSNWPSDEATPPMPSICPAGQRNGFLAFGQDDWSLDASGSLHACGYGDRSKQTGICSRLPTKPAGGNPSGWYFNTSCATYDGVETECGHTGWWMEGTYISSCATHCEDADHCDCHADNSVSSLDLYVNLETSGSVGFSYTAHGERFFDYMEFMINDQTAHVSMNFWEPGDRIRSFGLALPKGEHKLTWRWVKDYSVSEGSDRATLQQLVVTGLGAADNQCSGCPAGSCGTAGAVEGCSVCPPSSKSKEVGSVKCEKCDPAPDSAHHIGPPEWPAVGNTDTCGWECSEGYCSRDGTPRCPASMSCPPGMCCATSDGCTIPSIDAVRNGLSPATLQMLNTCLKLIPVDVVSASVTLDVATRLLGSGGLWRSRGEALGENSKAIVEAMQVLSSSKGEAIDGLLGKIAVSVRDQTLDPVTHIPKVSDWYGVHGPIGKALRSVGEINLRYSPPEFYQRISVFLPWSIALAFDPPGFGKKCATDQPIDAKGYAPGACPRLVIKGLNPAAQGRGSLIRPTCKCQTCKCPAGQEAPPASDLIGWSVTGLDLDGSGVKDAVYALKEWAKANVGVEDVGTAMMLALASGEGSADPTGNDARAGSNWWRTDSRPDAAGQMSCSLTHRTLSDCVMPTCTDDFCHVTLQLESPEGRLITIDMPWTVAYAASEPVSCTDSKHPPFDANVECMRQVVHYGGKGLNPSSSTTSAVPTTCSSPRTFETAWLKQPPPPAASNFQGKCLARTIYTPKSSRGGGGSEVAPAAATGLATSSTFTSLESFDAASGHIFTDPDTQVKTGILSLRSFADEEVAINSLLGEFASLEVDSILVDVRGNPGGSDCHARELAYLLSDSYGSVDEVRAGASLTVRRSDLMEILGYAGLGGEGGLGQMCFARERTGKGGERMFQCEGVGGKGLGEALSCGDASACKGPSAWLSNCSACGGSNGELSRHFMPVCNSNAASRSGGYVPSLLSFLPGGYCPGVGRLGSGRMRTSKRWAGCSTCSLGNQACVSNTKCGFGRGSLIVLSDGRCTGACAAFVSLLQAKADAQVMTPGGAFRPLPALTLGGITASTEQVLCHLSGRGSAGNQTVDPSLHVETLRLPVRGQEFYFPIASADVAAIKAKPGAEGGAAVKQLQDMNPPVHFPPSKNAATCLPDMYMEAIAFSMACSVSRKDGKVFDLSQRGASEKCTVPYGAESSRSCSASCPERVRAGVCQQYAGDSSGDCQVTCWSACSASSCALGYKLLWDPTTQSNLCWSEGFRTGLRYRIGEIIGQGEAMQEYGWRASLSGVGAFFLCMFMMAVGAFGGYVAFSPDDSYRKAISSMFTDCALPLPSSSSISMPNLSALIPKWPKKSGGGDSIYGGNEFSGADASPYVQQTNEA